MKKTMLSLAVLSAMVSAYAQESGVTELGVIQITADLRGSTVDETPASVSIKTEEDLKKENITHTEDVIVKTPNVNFAGQSSRARHIQIRGMGERDEYVGAPNPSVGFAIDGIDFSGIGMVGSLFDVNQIEILRGPQGTRYGANALAGLINIQTNAPSATAATMMEGSLGEYGQKSFGLSTTGAFDEDARALYRFVMHKNQSDGFFENKHLRRDDTNNLDETQIRAKLRFLPNDNTKVDVSLMHFDLDNGYDAWTLDNSYNTLSDNPGKDIQRTNAAAVKVEYGGNENFTLISETTYVESEMTYAYDEDWTYDGYHALGYNGTYKNDKSRDNISQELRFVSNESARILNNTTDWVAGVYVSKLEEDNATEYYGETSTQYEMTKAALFGQLDYHINESTKLSVGLRAEEHKTQFSNSLGETFNPDETLWGGHLSITHALSDAHSVYASLSRGYKAGGFNTGLPAGVENKYRSFDSETANNLELGVKSSLLGGDLETELVAFYTQRNNAQFDGYRCEAFTTAYCNWVFFTENFDEAKNYGLEAAIDWRINKHWSLDAALGLLETSVLGKPLNDEFNVDGREQAHAPKYQFNIGVGYEKSGYFARVDARAMDAFYFSNSHNAKSDAYTVINAQMGYRTGSWELSLWGKNLADEKYATRGFFFGNDPAKDYADEAYWRLGDRRQFGVTARYYF